MIMVIRNWISAWIWLEKCFFLQFYYLWAVLKCGTHTRKFPQSTVNANLLNNKNLSTPKKITSYFRKCSLFVSQPKVIKPTAIILLRSLYYAAMCVRSLLNKSLAVVSGMISRALCLSSQKTMLQDVVDDDDYTSFPFLIVCCWQSVTLCDIIVVGKKCVITEKL